VRCVKCNGETKVKDSRSHKNTIRRRRICKKCEHRFFTFEVAEQPPKIIELKVETPKKRRTPKKQEPDFNNMTDDEIEEYFYK
jgi:transcriptional regulator NrdR family protein